ncbi:MAG: hypothetical protein PVJ55_01360 [Anaerolineae bacterium]|jgi:hypothetical protein
MNARLGLGEKRRKLRSKRNGILSRSRPERLSVGLVVGLLAIFTLLVGSAYAARVADVPCEVCAEASDPVQFRFMALRETSETRSGAIDARPLGIGEASDPAQYTFAAERAAREARLAEIARLRGLAGPAAGSWAGVNEVVHLRDRLEAGALRVVASAAEDSEIARLRGLATPSAAIGARADEVVHLRGLADAAARAATAGLARDAEIARLRGLAGPGAASRVRAHESVHLRGLVEAALSTGAEGGCAVC